MDAKRGRRILVGTSGGLYELRGDECAQVHALAGSEITALAREERARWAIVDGRQIWRARRDGAWQEVAKVKGRRLTCLVPTTAGLIVGTESAHLLRLADGALAPVRSFDEAEGRQEWYTPWGEPAEVRSIAADRSGAIYVNVHVGGVARSRDRGVSWGSTLDIETDVHQVIAHPTRPGVVLVAAAVGFGVSRDAGDSWSFHTEGLHASYLRAAAVSEKTVLVSASTGPGSRRSAVYRKALDRDEPFERCRQGLPEWFGENIDTDCLAAAGATVAFGVRDAVFRSIDRGGRWELATKGLPSVLCVAIE